MAIKTTAEWIEEYETAISNILLRGQDMTLNGKRQTLANLASLQSELKRLKAQYRAETQTGGLSINIGTHRRDY